jgi:hypothetical protein
METHAHEEAAGIRIPALSALDDVAGTAEQECADSRHDPHPVRTGKPQDTVRRDAIPPHHAIIEVDAGISQRDIINSLYWFYG